MKNNCWYPPAETSIPLDVLIKGFKGHGAHAEDVIRHEIKSPYCLYGPNGRVLLFSLLRFLFKVENGTRDEVVLPGYTCYSLAAAAIKARLKIRFYDIDPITLSPDKTTISHNCNEKTLAVVSQHLFGIPTRLSDINAITKARGIYHIEDAAQGYSGRSEQRFLGTTGDFGLFSFGRGKPLPIGGGGVLVSKQYPMDQVMKFQSSAGRYRAIINYFTKIAANPIIYGLFEKLPLGLGETHFDPKFDIGKINTTLANMVGPMIQYLPQVNSHRKKIAEIYTAGFSSKSLIKVSPDTLPVYTRFPLLSKKGNLPIDLRRLGVRRLYPKTISSEPKIKHDTQVFRQSLPGSEYLADMLITLPTHLCISECTARKIIQKVNYWNNC